jgi:hypothetical protein
MLVVAQGAALSELNLLPEVVQARSRKLKKALSRLNVDNW